VFAGLSARSPLSGDGVDLSLQPADGQQSKSASTKVRTIYFPVMLEILAFIPIPDST
jgi:hypothetical protein